MRKKKLITNMVEILREYIAEDEWLCEECDDVDDCYDQCRIYRSKKLVAKAEQMIPELQEKGKTK